MKSHHAKGNTILQLYTERNRHVCNPISAERKGHGLWNTLVWKAGFLDLLCLGSFNPGMQQPCVPHEQSLEGLKLIWVTEPGRGRPGTCRDSLRDRAKAPVQYENFVIFVTAHWDLVREVKWHRQGHRTNKQVSQGWPLTTSSYFMLSAWVSGGARQISFLSLPFLSSCLYHHLPPWVMTFQQNTKWPSQSWAISLRFPVSVNCRGYLNYPNIGTTVFYCLLFLQSLSYFPISKPVFSVLCVNWNGILGVNSESSPLTLQFSVGASWPGHSTPIACLQCLLLTSYGSQ